MSGVVERTDMVLPGPALALAGLLGVEAPDVEQGAPLPLLWHWLYTLERPAQVDLGPDGHPTRGVIPVPPGPGMRRMWAGGRVRSTGPLRCGEPVTRRTAVARQVDKDGRTGPLTITTMSHQMVQRGQVVVEEEQDIVYRPAPAAATPGAPGESERTAAQPQAGEWRIDTTPTLLFGYSALTYNAHRIHYDRDYVRQVEGYPGLLVHGPLQAVAMAEAVRARHRDVVDGALMNYRLVAPLFDHQDMYVSTAAGADTVQATVRGASGHRSAASTFSR